MAGQKVEADLFFLRSWCKSLLVISREMCANLRFQNSSALGLAGSQLMCKDENP